MYAVFRTGGKQLRVEPGTKLRIPTLEAEEGTTVSFDEVLFTSDGEAISVGQPMVKGASVKAEILRHGKDRKIIVFKRKKRKGYRRKQGHRQKFTEIKVAEIKL